MHVSFAVGQRPLALPHRRLDRTVEYVRDGFLAEIPEGNTVKIFRNEREILPRVKHPDDAVPCAGLTPLPPKHR